MPPSSHPSGTAAAAAHNAEALLPLVYDELRRIAAEYLRRDRPDHTLQPTALVHEAFVRMLRQSSAQWRDEGHFRAVAATAMRQILVDHARARQADKRGGDCLRVTLAQAEVGAIDRDAGELDFDMLALDEALHELGRIDHRRASVVDLHFFGGLSFRELAQVLDIAPKTAESDWYFARAWLRKRLAGKPV